MHLSQFAETWSASIVEVSKSERMACQGDYVPFFYQTEPGNYNLEMTCPNCGKNGMCLG